ncbi:MAG: hypothetical protein QOC98_1794 [Frankiaceae bacterium]|nr:hypothetical protein [Frankiaceae bacterium]
MDHSRRTLPGVSAPADGPDPDPAPDPDPDPFAGWARRLYRPLEALHIVGYFAEETTQAYLGIGLTDYGMGYFASRSAAMGPVRPEVTTATFYVFSAPLVAAFLPRAWGLASPEDIVDARLRGIEAALRRGLGDAADSAEVAEAAELAGQALVGLETAGRPLAAAHLGLPVPSTPLLALWHAITVLREYRGDGHLAALVLAGLDPVESLVTAVAGGGPAKFLKSTRGWSPEQWAAGQTRLRERGLLDDDNSFTDAGQAVRETVEHRTDAAAAAPWRRLGEPGCARLLELARPRSRSIAASGILPARLAGPDPS